MILKAENFKKFLDHVPDDFEITFNKDGIEHLVQDNIEINISEKKVILKS